MTTHVVEMWRWCDHIIDCFEAWWKIANQLLVEFVENVGKDRCVGSIFRNQFHSLLMVVSIESTQLQTSHSATNGECTTHWSGVDWGSAINIEHPWRKIHFTRCIRSIKGLLMVPSMFFIIIGISHGLQQHLKSMIQWMATGCMWRYSNVWMAEMDISDNLMQTARGVIWTQHRWGIKWSIPSETFDQWKLPSKYTFYTKRGACLSSSWPGSSCAEVVNKVFHRSPGYISHVCSNGQ